MYSNITGVILAGGKSSRMGVNKSFLKLGSQTIIEHIVNLMKSIFSEVIIITNTPDEYKFLNLPLYEDIYKWKGPLAGIHSALTHSQTEKIFVLSCDVPLMSKDMIEYLIEYKSVKSVIFCEAAGYHQPLVGVYSKKILSEIEKFISNNEMSDKSFHHFLENIDIEIIHPEDLPFYRDEIYLNINRPIDYEMVLSVYNTKR